MRASRGMGIISPAKNPKRKTVVKRDGPEPVSLFAKGGKVDHPSGGSRVNEAGVYTKPGMRKSLFESIKSRETQGTKAGQWSARKAQLLAKQYKARGGGYRG